MRKRIWSAVLAAALLLSLGGCGGTGGTVAAAEAEETAAALCRALREGDFGGAQSYFSKDMTKAVDPAALEETYLQFDGLTGPPQNTAPAIETTEETDRRLFSCVVSEDRENGQLIVHVVVNQKNGKVEGIHFDCRPYDAKVSNDRLEEVAITVGADTELPLEGLLTLPKGVERPPVVLLIAGSGPCDRNESIYLNAPMRDLAHGLAARGIASLRYDKRYAAYPGLAAARGFLPTLEDEVLEDADRALALLRQDGRVNGNRIFVLGHSLGGGLTPYFAVSHPGEVRGIISVAGTLRPLFEVSYDQNKALEAELLKDADQKTQKEIKKQMKPIEEDIEVLRTGLDTVKDDKILLGMQASYQKSLKQYAGENYIEQVAVPVLAVQGGRDFQVFPDKDFPLWETALAGRSHAETHLYPELNHMMMPWNGKQDMSEYMKQGSVSEEVITDIADFIHENCR